MNLKYLYILILFFSLKGNGQVSFRLVNELHTSATDFTTDNLNKIYLAENNEVFKLNYKGDTLFTYSNKTLGNISKIDVTNTLRPLLFFKGNSQIIATDNTLSEQQKSYNLEELGLFQAQLIASSLIDNGIWIYDQELFQLIKVNKAFERIYESGNLEQILLKDSLNPTHLVEYRDNVYLTSPHQGVLIFDIYGSYIRTIPILGLTEIQVVDKMLYYKKEDKFWGYSLLNFSETEIVLPVDSFQKVRIEKDYMLVFSKGKVSIYTIQIK